MLVCLSIYHYVDTNYNMLARYWQVFRFIQINEFNNSLNVIPCVVWTANKNFVDTSWIVFVPKC